MKIDFQDDDFEIIEAPVLSRESSAKAVDASFIVHFGMELNSRTIPARGS
jgi:hypothetical protein